MTTDYKTLWHLKTQLTLVKTDDLSSLNFIHQFADFTKDMIIQGKTDVAERCFFLAEKVLIKSDKQFKSIFTTAFFYPLSLAIAYSHCENIIPTLLRDELHNFELNLIHARQSNIDEL
jgi:hypothetical protein